VAPAFCYFTIAFFVMVGLDPTIHAAGAAWILGSSPRMTERRDWWLDQADSFAMTSSDTSKFE
jgi:hypothetical protein